MSLFKASQCLRFPYIKGQFSTERRRDECLACVLRDESSRERGTERLDLSGGWGFVFGFVDEHRRLGWRGRTWKARNPFRRLDKLHFKRLKDLHINRSLITSESMQFARRMRSVCTIWHTGALMLLVNKHSLAPAASPEPEKSFKASRTWGCGGHKKKQKNKTWHYFENWGICKRKNNEGGVMQSSQVELCAN